MDIEGTKMVVGQHRMACIFGGIGLSVRKKKVPGRKVFDLYKKMCLASYFTRPNAYDLTASTFTCVGIFFNVVAHTARSIYPSMETGSWPNLDANGVYGIYKRADGILDTSMLLLI
ncbi:uncharacterized protein isoform X1 [Musca autumnalis]|uniref:uncharacterized protein isoform X1 n=1 Tax=Musca autumnalis TaxID=221902 RepID=UPI003CF9F161